jgi:hypothetical protein
MPPAPTPKPRSASTPSAPHRSGPPCLRDGGPRDGGRAVSLPRAVSGLVLGAAFLACGDNGNTGTEGGAFRAPAGARADSPAAPMGGGNPGTGATDSSTAAGTGTSSPTGSGEVKM